jgi:hypothetical protein
LASIVQRNIGAGARFLKQTGRGTLTREKADESWISEARP